MTPISHPSSERNCPQWDRLPRELNSLCSKTYIHMASLLKAQRGLYSRSITERLYNKRLNESILVLFIFSLLKKH